MHLLPLLLLPALISYQTQAQPLNNTPTNSIANALLAISPSTATCTPASINPSTQCRTATQAAPYILSSFTQYNITNTAERAAILSLIVYESGNLLYNRNIYPGRPGQGTRNMQMIPFNVLYAQSSAAAGRISSASLSSIAGASAVSGQKIDPALLSDAQANAVVDLLVADEDLDWGSAAWFLNTQCTAEVRAALQTGTVDGWRGYVQGCIGTTATADREGLFQGALAALGE